MTYHTRIEHIVTLTPLRGLFSMSATHIDLHLQIDREDRIRTKLNTKRDDVNFPAITIS